MPITLPNNTCRGFCIELFIFYSSQRIQNKMKLPPGDFDSCSRFIYYYLHLKLTEAAVCVIIIKTEHLEVCHADL